MRDNFLGPYLSHLTKATCNQFEVDLLQVDSFEAEQFEVDLFEIASFEVYSFKIEILHVCKGFRNGEGNKDVSFPVL